MKPRITIRKYKPKTLGYYDREGFYHGSYIVSGGKYKGRNWKNIITSSKYHAKTIAKARRNILRRK